MPGTQPRDLDPLPTIESIRAARLRVAEYVERTSLVRSPAFSELSGADVRLKLEIEQPTGSFKVRGACNAVRRLLETGSVRGICTASTGNHARAVGYIGRIFDLRVRAFVAATVPSSRVRALKEMGVDVDLDAADQTAAINAARDYALAHDYGFIPPFDHPDVISGQGTIGIELAEDLPRLDAVIVPVSGGGLICGIGLALRALVPAARVIGVCAQNSPAMKDSLAAGTPVSVPEIPTIATSLMGDLGPDNRYTFRAAAEVVDELVTVSDDQIGDAVTAIHDHEGLVVEPAGAAGVAHLIAAGRRFAGQQVALVLTGNAVDRN